MYTNREPTVIEDKSAEVRRHYQSAAVAVFIPGLQALLTGVFVAVAVGVVSRSWLYGFVSLALVACVTWLALLSGWRGLVMRLETALGYDLNADGDIGEVEPERVRIELTDKTDGGHRTQIAELDCEPQKLTDLARSLLSGATFSESQFSGAGALFSRKEFRIVRDEFLKRGWLEWRNEDAPAQGLELTRTGGAIVRHFASMGAGTHPPTLRARRTQDV